MQLFEGIRYSSTTDIFYKWCKGQLQRYGVFKDPSNISTLYKWVDSDYKDMSGNSKKWLPITETQIKEYRGVDS